jgi:hypothetical protein
VDENFDFKQVTFGKLIIYDLFVRSTQKTPLSKPRIILFSRFYCNEERIRGIMCLIETIIKQQYVSFSVMKCFYVSMMITNDIT